ncbi:probable Dihydrolipoyllysine-residue acetyltransferase component of pyruvate dehydrogenase complex, mitochondrial [Saccharomycodes ludwigii]|uniref:Acetyltransferase component of pyruvate dehydrogenase complex n=1 Tax=Saccharomycodes ludwigii TaxID=36035 RepID=A0A376B4M5_9ASCO|nr:probable Dihydrolipoyllysine-residue acetyltransferase component of pyruvate dehydrogenase complex, mitochondrial [Saccharomycodes ludwigii]
MLASSRVLSRLGRTVAAQTTTTRSLLLSLRTYATSYPPHHVIGMPALSPTMTKGNLAAWSKKEGDKLEPGEVLAEVETDKAQMDFEFQEDGYLAKILVPAGTKNIAVNTPIAVYVDSESDVPAFKDFKLDGKSGKSSTQGGKEKEKENNSSSSTKPSSAESSPATSSGTKADPTRIFASPLAKTIALEHGIALKDLKGTGPNGRIVKADVEAYLKAGKNPAASVSASAPAAPIPASATYTDIPISTMREIIGNRLLQSTQSIPSYIVSSDISVGKLLKLRKSLNTDAKEFKLSINDILIKAVSVAAKKVPDSNAYWLEEQGVIRQFHNVDVSVAVATPTGLITPIVKNADAMGLVTISKTVKELVGRAKDNKLKPEEFQGGTICISNLGMNPACSMFSSIINPPQSTILAIGTTRRVAVEDASAEHGFSFDSQMTITGTFDHRTIDGAKAGEFMRALKRVIENPLELLL